MNSIDVSIIVPVYNSKLYLEQAVSSILSQDYESFELLLIDDGSTDGSEIICDKFAQKDKRIKVIHKENGGMCQARNVGLQQAQGKYILFCDNDDLFLEGLVRENVAFIEKYDADIVKFSRLRVHIDNDKITPEAYTYSYDFEIIDGDDLQKRYNHIRNISSGVWCNLYKKDIIEKYNIRFPEDFRYGYEDLYFNVLYLKHVKKIVMNPKIYYHWIQRDTHSTTKKYNENLIYALEQCLNLEYGFVKEKNILQYSGVWEDILTNYYVFGIFLCMMNPKIPYSFSQKIQFIKKYSDKKVFQNVSKEQLSALKKINWKRYYILKAFLHGHFRIDYAIVYFYSKYISKIM